MKTFKVRVWTGKTGFQVKVQANNAAQACVKAMMETGTLNVLEIIEVI